MLRGYLRIIASKQELFLYIFFFSLSHFHFLSFFFYFIFQCPYVIIVVYNQLMILSPIKFSTLQTFWYKINETLKKRHKIRVERNKKKYCNVIFFKFARKLHKMKRKERRKKKKHKIPKKWGIKGQSHRQTLFKMHEIKKKKMNYFFSSFVSECLGCHIVRVCRKPITRTVSLLTSASFLQNLNR